MEHTIIHLRDMQSLNNLYELHQLPMFVIPQTDQCLDIHGQRNRLDLNLQSFLVLFLL